MKKIAAIVRNHVSPNASMDVQDVINQSRFVSRVLREQGWSVVEVELGTDIGEVVSTLRGIRPYVVFNLVESFMGSDELASMAPVIFRNLGLSYTGAESPVLFMTNDKLAAKRHMLSVALPTPFGLDEIGLKRGRFNRPGRYIIKSRYEHASLGLDETSVVYAEKAEDLLAAMDDQRSRLGGFCIAEEFIAGREFSVSLLESPNGECLILGSAEIAFRADMPVKIVGYEAKWEEGSDADKSTVRGFGFRKAEPELSRLLEKTAFDCWEEMGLSGYARVDFRVDDKGSVYIIDVNANPCLSEDAGFIATAIEVGWKSEAVISAIVKSALGRYAN
ncbi:ATP-grasp domain-containing protein [Maridesulfovibrio ferrireducens]|uniref:ATP-grasp domain-containing protein n=1 Tax=Maridesulfovibrio ferrireducens TaxID=246191 RepID=UPI001A32CFE2|nr:ATP-grasp domain-containing protein [Maridesulfovibrio ferrireducens]MBI9112176.1 ATP-grasp domain-containing protein [Maridesulfovibrio ferrireducens]